MGTAIALVSIGFHRVPEGALSDSDRSVLYELRLKLQQAKEDEYVLSVEEVRALRADALLQEFAIVQSPEVDVDREEEVLKRSSHPEKPGESMVAKQKRREEAERRAKHKQLAANARWTKMRPKDRDRVQRLRSRLRAVDQGRLPPGAITSKDVRALEMTLVRTHPHAVLDKVEEKDYVQRVRAQARRLYEMGGAIQAHRLNTDTGVFEEAGPVAGPFASLVDAYKFFHVYNPEVDK